MWVGEHGFGHPSAQIHVQTHFLAHKWFVIHNSKIKCLLLHYMPKFIWIVPKKEIVSFEFWFDQYNHLHILLIYHKPQMNWNQFKQTTNKIQTMKPNQVTSFKHQIIWTYYLLTSNQTNNIWINNTIQMHLQKMVQYDNL